ncbi:acyltransferase family protein [Lysobacter claricitrinus]|uniref:acyltransferase family protein n=1 Tax=Lysobacter claricitrinus TaxID=3367728 RepID=UPI0037DBA757
MNERIRGLDGLRALAIVWVMLFHSWVVGGLGRWDWLATPGWMGVDLFFVLSGYLIASQVFAGIARGERFSYVDFYTRRAFRILPAFLVVLGVYVAAPAIREAKSLPPVWMFLTFTQNLLVDYAHDRAFSHAWSLCVEEHFYLLFPALALLLARRARTRGVAAIALALVIGGIAWRALVWTHGLAPLGDASGDPSAFGARWVEWIYYPTWCRLDGLLFGVLLAAVRTWRPSWWTAIEARNGAIASTGFACLVLAVLITHERDGLLASVAGFPLVSFAMALLVAAGASSRSWISRLTPPGAGWIAAASYSLYLTHKAVFAVVDDALPEDVHGLARFAVIGAGAVAVGALLHYVVERPGLRMRRRLLRRRAATAMALPEAV